MELRDREIVFASNDLAGGGAARVICTLADEFSRRGKRVGVAVYKDHSDEYPIQEGMKEYGPDGAGVAAKARRVAWLRSVARRNPKATIVAFEYFVNMQVILACTGLPNRVVVSERNDPERVGADVDRLRELLYRRADMLVCQTEGAAAHFSDRVHKCVIPNPLKEGLPEPFSGVRRRAVVTFCRLERQKNLGMLLRAFAAFSAERPGYTLEVYGDGSERDRLAALAEELGIAGRTSISPARPDVHEAVRDAAMFVLPSDYEGLSNSMLEAMAMGLPVICTDCPCGGARMVVRDGVNGFLAPVGDERALEEGMCAVADGALPDEAVRASALSLRESLSSERIAGRWLEVIE